MTLSCNWIRRCCPGSAACKPSSNSWARRPLAVCELVSIPPSPTPAPPPPELTQNPGASDPPWASGWGRGVWPVSARLVTRMISPSEQSGRRVQHWGAFSRASPRQGQLRCGHRASPSQRQLPPLQNVPRAPAAPARDTMCSPLQALFFLAGLLLHWRPSRVTQCSFCSLATRLPSHLHPTPPALP